MGGDFPTSKILFLCKNFTILVWVISNHMMTQHEFGYRIHQVAMVTGQPMNAQAERLASGVFNLGKMQAIGTEQMIHPVIYSK
jgi:hypothetical protein